MTSELPAIITVVMLRNVDMDLVNMLTWLVAWGGMCVCLFGQSPTGLNGKARIRPRLSATANGSVVPEVVVDVSSFRGRRCTRTEGNRDNFSPTQHLLTKSSLTFAS